jgi:predicted nicotinamide N-methyase
MAADPLRTSLEEQLTRMRGGATLPDALLDVELASECDLTLVKPRDWDELRHQEGAAGRSAPYWALPWPSGRALAAALQAGAEAEPDALKGQRVLELGCGLALPSLVASRAGARVLATDGSPDAVVFAAHNLALNELEGEVALADWRESRELVDGAPWDLVLAADVLYLQHNVDALLRLLPRLMGDTGEALIADPNRAGGRDFIASAKRIFDLERSSAPGHENVNLLRLRSRSNG